MTLWLRVGLNNGQMAAVFVSWSVLSVEYMDDDDDYYDYNSYYYHD